MVLKRQYVRAWVGVGEEVALVELCCLRQRVDGWRDAPAGLAARERQGGRREVAVAVAGLRQGKWIERRWD